LKVTAVQDMVFLIDTIMSHFDQFRSAMQKPTNIIVQLLSKRLLRALQGYYRGSRQHGHESLGFTNSRRYKSCSAVQDSYAMSDLNYGSIATATVTSSANCSLCELRKVTAISGEPNFENKNSANE